MATILPAFDVTLVPGCGNVFEMEGSTMDSDQAPASPVLDLSDLQPAYERTKAFVIRTPTVPAPGLSSVTGLDVWLKAELLQTTGSFKLRGVLNALRQLDGAARAAGVVSMSAGNHASALAYAARIAGTRATVVMPQYANPAKVAATISYGGEVIQTDRPLAEVMAEVQQQRGLTLVHPFDDLRVIAGAGGVGLEMIEDGPKLDAIIVPVGGGGLISGVAAAVRMLSPQTRVIGVEPAWAPGMSAALQAGRPVQFEQARSVADGLAAPFAGYHTLACVQSWVDSIVLVEEHELVAAVGVLAREAKLAAEAAGAAGLAALRSGAVDLAPGTRVGLVVSGGNVDPALLASALTAVP
jgi:threonine dehydratase